MDIRTYLRATLKSAVTMAFGDDVASSCDYIIERPRNRAFGDLCTPLCMNLAKKIKVAPPVIARTIAECVTWNASFVDDPRHNIVGGFINFRMSRAYLYGMLHLAVTAPEIVGRQQVAHPPTVCFGFADAHFTERMAAFDARQCNLLRHAAVQGFSDADVRDVDPALLVEPEEMEILAQLAEFPHVLAQAAAATEPLRITTYVEGLAAAFHAFYQKHRVVSDNRALSASRLQLTCGVRNVVSVALRMLGVSSPESM